METPNIQLVCTLVGADLELFKEGREASRCRFYSVLKLVETSSETLRSEQQLADLGPTISNYKTTLVDTYHGHYN